MRQSINILISDKDTASPIKSNLIRPKSSNIIYEMTNIHLNNSNNSNKSNSGTALDSGSRPTIKTTTTLTSMATNKASKVVKFEAGAVSSSLISDSDSSGGNNNNNNSNAASVDLVVPVSLCRRLFRQKKQPTNETLDPQLSSTTKLASNVCYKLIIIFMGFVY